MAGLITLGVPNSIEVVTYTIKFGEEVPKDVKRKLLKHDAMITLSDQELAIAVNSLGASPTHGRKEVSYYGDEAKRIIGNW